MKLFVRVNALGKGEGIVLTAHRVIEPENNPKGATEYVICNPYRRVYEDESGLWVKWYGKKASVYEVVE